MSLLKIRFVIVGDLSHSERSQHCIIVASAACESGGPGCITLSINGLLTRKRFIDNIICLSPYYKRLLFVKLVLLIKQFETEHSFCSIIYDVFKIVLPERCFKLNINERDVPRIMLQTMQLKGTLTKWPINEAKISIVNTTPSL